MNPYLWTVLWSTNFMILYLVYAYNQRCLQYLLSLQLNVFHVALWLRSTSLYGLRADWIPIQLSFVSQGNLVIIVQPIILYQNEIMNSKNYNKNLCCCFWRLEFSKYNYKYLHMGIFGHMLVESKLLVQNQCIQPFNICLHAKENPWVHIHFISI